MNRVEGKIAFITGAGQGQGRAHAVRLAEEGADIIATDICAPYPSQVRYKAASEEDLAETKLLVEKTGRRCVTAIADVRDRAALDAAVQQGVDELGGLDIVVGNAGVITMADTSLDVPEADFDLIVDTNLKGVWNTLQATSPVLIEQGRGGSIILTASAAALRGHTNYAHYGAAKAAVVHLGRSFANELGKYRIRVNSVSPTGVTSPGMGNMALSQDELASDSRTFRSGSLTVLPNLDSPLDAPFLPVPALGAEEIANAVLFLASDESRYVTGTVLPVDAGNTNKP